MKNEVLGWGMVITMGLAFLIGFFDVYINDGGWTMLGALFMFFGIWGGIRLINSK